MADLLNDVSIIIVTYQGGAILPRTASTTSPTLAHEAGFPQGALTTLNDLERENSPEYGK